MLACLSRGLYASRSGLLRPCVHRGGHFRIADAMLRSRTRCTRRNVCHSACGTLGIVLGLNLFILYLLGPASNRRGRLRGDSALSGSGISTAWTPWPESSRMLLLPRPTPGSVHPHLAGTAVRRSTSGAMRQLSRPNADIAASATSGNGTTAPEPKGPLDGQSNRRGKSMDTAGAAVPAIADCRERSSTLCSLDGANYTCMSVPGSVQPER